MRFRLGLILGLAIGYVLGAKAGRERYHQIQSLARQLARTEPAQQISGEVRTAAARAGGKIEEAATDTITHLTERVRSVAGDSGPSGGTDGATSPRDATPR